MLLIAGSLALYQVVTAHTAFGRYHTMYGICHAFKTGHLKNYHLLLSKSHQIDELQFRSNFSEIFNEYPCEVMT